MTQLSSHISGPLIITLLDVDYLPKLVVMYHSLRQFWPETHLVVYCFDELTFTTLSALQLPFLTPIALREFETTEHRQALKKMTRLYEYYWAMKPHLLLETWRHYPSVENILYLDCDTMFFSHPGSMLLPSGNSLVLLQPNNFSAQEMDQFVPIGYYCAGFVSIRNTEKVEAIFEWWNERCLEWCYAKVEDGKFGDQKYLDDWRMRFEGVEEIVSIGAGLAPWNIQKYDVTHGVSGPEVNGQPVVYYHYHSLAMNYQTFEYQLTGDRENTYTLQPEAVKILYEPYLTALQQTVKELSQIADYQKYIQQYPRGTSKFLSENHEYFSFRLN